MERNTTTIFASLLLLLFATGLYVPIKATDQGGSLANNTPGDNNNQDVTPSKPSPSLWNINNNPTYRSADDPNWPTASYHDNKTKGNQEAETFSDSSGKQVEDDKTKEQGQDNNNPDEEEPIEDSNETTPELQSQNNSIFSRRGLVIFLVLLAVVYYTLDMLKSSKKK